MSPLSGFIKWYDKNPKLTKINMKKKLATYQTWQRTIAHNVNQYFHNSSEKIISNSILLIKSKIPVSFSYWCRSVSVVSFAGITWENDYVKKLNSWWSMLFDIMFIISAFSMNKVLFLEPVESYVGKDNWPPENDRRWGNFMLR